MYTLLSTPGSRRGPGYTGCFVAQGQLGLAAMRERAAMIGGQPDGQTAAKYDTTVILEPPL